MTIREHITEAIKGLKSLKSAAGAAHELVQIQNAIDHLDLALDLGDELADGILAEARRLDGLARRAAQEC